MASGSFKPKDYSALLTQTGNKDYSPVLNRAYNPKNVQTGGAKAGNDFIGPLQPSYAGRLIANSGGNKTPGSAQTGSMPGGVAGRSNGAATDAFGNMASRSFMTGAGLDNNKIGYDDTRGMVTYNGKDFAQAAYEQDGTSYLNPTDAHAALRKYYKGNGENLVEATPYLAGQGSPYQVDYNSGTMTVGGLPVDVAYVENGKAWVLESDLQKALGQLNSQSGFRNRNDVLQEYSDKYQPMQDSLLQRITDRKPFTYDPETDQVFQAYRQQYNREGNRSMEDVMGTANALTGGLTNSAAVTAAGQARQYWSDKLMDRIPELEANAYNRYLQDYNMDRQALGDLMNAYNADFQRAYGVNNDIYNDMLTQREWDYNRDQDAWQRNWQDRFYDQTYRGNEKDIWWKDADNTLNYETQQLNNELAIADAVGKFRQDFIQRYGIDPDSSPYAKLQYQAQLQQWLAEQENELNKDYLKYNTDLSWEDDLRRAQYGANFSSGSSRSGGGSSGSSSSRKSSGGSSSGSTKKAVSDSEVKKWVDYFNSDEVSGKYGMKALNQTGANSWQVAPEFAEKVAVDIMRDSSGLSQEEKEYLIEKFGVSKSVETNVMKDRHYKNY